MNLIEERIRAAAQAAAETVTPDSVPPLELPAARPGRVGWPGRVGRRRRQARPAGSAWTPWAVRLAPLAAGLAIVALVITMVAVSHPERYGPSTGAATAAGPDVPAGPPASSYVRSGQVPQYYVAITPGGAEVRLTASGATVATIAPSLPGGTVVAVTAAADDRTFVLAEHGHDDKAVTFYRFRLGSSGRPGTLTRLPMSVGAGETMTGLALSPDGARIAIAIAFKGGIQQISVYLVRGRLTSIWNGGGGTIGVQFAIKSLSWSASQHALAFNWSVGQTSSIRLLNPDGPSGGDLVAASHPVVTLANWANMGQTLYQCGFLIITPDGSQAVCASGTITKIAKNGVITYSTGFPEFSTATGRVTRIAGHWPQPQDQKVEPTAIDVLWSDASGRVLIGVVNSAGREWIGIISGNKFTPLNAQWTLSAYDFGTW